MDSDSAHRASKLLRRLSALRGCWSLESPSVRPVLENGCSLRGADNSSDAWRPGKAVLLSDDAIG